MENSIYRESAISTAYAEALAALRLCIHSSGLKASGEPHGHHQVWARDSMITLLGASLADDDCLRGALEASLATLEAHQTFAGLIPNNVDAASGKPNFRAYADGGLWYVIGSAILRPNPAAIRRALAWYECQDVDRTGMLSMQESSDWQDLFCTRGKGLYLNCLYSLALRKAAPIAPGSHEKAERLKAAVNRFLWYRGDGRMLRHISHTFSSEGLEADSLGRKRWVPEKRILTGERYYLPYLSFREVGEWFDVLGNLLAILSGIADPEQARLILEFIERHELAKHPARAIFPVVMPGDPDWRDYYGSLNLPHHYHNGGIWPFIGGFYVAALVKTGEHEQAEKALARLAALNRAGCFNEWHHGQTAAPMGVNQQAWSAGMYIYACECVRRGETPYF